MLGIKMRIIYISFLVAHVLLAVDDASAESYEDKRCRCLCAIPSAIFNYTGKPGNVNTGKDRNVFTGNISPNMCSCEDWLLTLVEVSVGQEHLFCLRCECKFETRNTTMIMVVVLIIISVIVSLTVYMTFLVCLHPIMRLHKVRPYRNVRHRPVERRRLLLQDDIDDD